jgi:hypothetical protein
MTIEKIKIEDEVKPEVNAKKTRSRLRLRLRKP